MRIIDFQDGFESSVAPDVIVSAASSIVVTPAGNLSSTNVQSALTELQTDIDTNLASQIAGDVATLDSANDYTDTALAALVASAPGTLDTLDELAQALGDDPNFATTVATSIGNKVALSSFTAKGDILVGTGAGTLVKLAVGANGTIPQADSTQASGIKWAVPAYTAPKITRYTSGTGVTHTITGSPVRLRVTVVGGGGPGGGAGASTVAPDGGNSTFATSGGSTLISVEGGKHGRNAGASLNYGGFGGGFVTINSPAVMINGAVGAAGHVGQASTTFGVSGAGGASMNGGAGPGAINAAGATAVANSGAGGGGGSPSTALNAGYGGGGGAWAVCDITGTIASSYLVTVGAGGVATGGTPTGGNGAAGVVIVEEYYS